jgi:hypothetical protein
MLLLLPNPGTVVAVGSTPIVQAVVGMVQPARDRAVAPDTALVLDKMRAQDERRGGKLILGRAPDESPDSC